MNDIITEINQELRQDRSKALWNKWGLCYRRGGGDCRGCWAASHVGYENSARENAANTYLTAVEAETPRSGSNRR